MALLRPVTPLQVSIGECGHAIVREHDTGELTCTHCGELLMAEWRDFLVPLTNEDALESAICADEDDHEPVQQYVMQVWGYSAREAAGWWFS